MGITIVQKSDLSQVKKSARRALVLAGGAISGGAFKVGGLLALDRFLVHDRVTSFDIYMGISAGAFLAAPLAAGVEPHELMAALRGAPGRLTMFRPTHFYNPNLREFVTRPARLFRDALSFGPRVSLNLMGLLPRRHREIRSLVGDFLDEPGMQTAEALLEPFVHELVKKPWGQRGGYLPSGLFDNSMIERYIRNNLEANGLPNSFRQLKLTTGKSLYIGATNLNTAQGVVFGHDEDTSVAISEAVQASTAIPGFFRPARVGPPGLEQDYCDAAIRKTANISTAVRHGAQLVICYNPFRPFVNHRHRLSAAERTSLADQGIPTILNQAFRTLLHSRLRLGIEKLRLDESFRGDVILIEPTESDHRFFTINPVAFWKREEAAYSGYESTKASLEKHYQSLKHILRAYGIDCSLSGLQGGLDDLIRSRRPEHREDLAEPTRRAGLRVVSGGRG